MELTELSRKMIKIADRDNLPPEHQMRVMARDFDTKAQTGTTKQILGAWARARLAYCEYTGKPLI